MSVTKPSAVTAFITKLIQNENVETKKKEKNLIITGLPRPNSTSEQNPEEDKKAVLKLLNHVTSKANKGNRAHNKGTAMTEEQKAIIRATKEKNKVMLTCEVCNKTMRESHFKMYKHGVNCTAINIS